MQQILINYSGRLFSTLFFTLALAFTACEKDKDTAPEQPSSTWRLDYMEIEERTLGGRLYLHGYFGDSSASAGIRINDVLIVSTDSTYLGRLRSWTPWLVVCDIPGVESPSGKGKVQVCNRGKCSNTRTLTAWHGDLWFRRPDQGTLEREIQFDFYLRADADPHVNTAAYVPRSGFCSRSRAYYILGGQGQSTYTNGNCMTTVTASLAPSNGVVYPIFPFLDRASEPEYWQSLIRFQNNRFEVEAIEIFKENISTRTMTVLSCPGTSTSQIVHDLWGLPGELQTFNLEIEPGSKYIKAGQLTHKASSEMGLIWDEGQVPQYNCTLSWGVIKPM